MYMFWAIPNQSSYHFSQKHAQVIILAKNVYETMAKLMKSMKSYKLAVVNT